MSSRSFAPTLVALALGISGCTIQDDPTLSPRPDGGPDAGEVDAGAPDAGFTCEPDAPGCFGFVHYVCGSDGASRVDEELCEGSCDPAMGCIECAPGTFRCDGTVSMRCDEDHRWVPLRDCSEWGSTCGAAGYCEDACGNAEAVRSNVGCEYWPVPLANSRELDTRIYDFRVVVTNPGAQPADVTIHRGSRIVETARVQPGSVAEIVLPWIDGVSFPFAENDWQSVVTANGAYRLTSSRPVIVAQFNPFQYASAVGGPSFTNDASLLYPTHVLGRSYVGTSYVPYSRSAPSFDVPGEYVSPVRLPGYLAIVGIGHEPTEVEVVVAGDVAADAGGRWPATPRGGTLRFTLGRGEVAQIAAAVPPVCSDERPGTSRVDSVVFCREEQYDLTGSIVRTDRPVAVFGAHTCANVPYDVFACDHLETQLAPVETWGERFSTIPLREPGRTEVPNLLRITAAHDDTVVTITPAPREGGSFTLDAGEHAEVLIEGAVEIVGDHPIQVAQLLVGQNITEPPLERGDPSMTVLVPFEQFRQDYVFVTPSSYTPLANGQSYVLVSRERGVDVVLDGESVSATWTEIGGRELAVVPIRGGTHRLESRSPVGLIAFGVGAYTSYAYPAGLDLRVIPF